MKRSLLALIMLASGLLLSGGLPSAALAYTSTGTGYPLIVVDNGPGSQSDPHVSGRYAIYTDVDASGANTIKYFDFANRSTSTVPSGSTTNDVLSDISGGTIVLTRVDTASGSAAIYSDSIGGTPTEVAPVPPPALPSRSNPAIGGSTIVWEDAGVSGSSDPELVVDSGGSVTQLTSDAAADQNPNVSPDGSTITWEKCAVPGACDIYAAVKSASSWNISPIATSSANETSADTNGNLVVYASSGQIHLRPLGGGNQPITLPAGLVSADHPAIAGDFVAFEASNGAQTDIWVYDVADNSFRQITNTPERERLADVTVTSTGGTSTVTVVWQVLETETNVYATQFQVSSQPPFTDQFLQPLTQSTDPANPALNTGKNGRVIPVKVQIGQGGTAITDQNAPGPVTIAVSKLASCSSSAGSDPITSYADAGQSSAGTNQFHYDATAQAWTYNLDTKALGLVTGNCYRIDVAVNGTQITNAFAVFQPTR